MQQQYPRQLTCTNDRETRAAQYQNKQAILYVTVIQSDDWIKLVI